MTPDQKLQRRRLNRKILIYLFGPIGLLITGIALSFGVWGILAIGLPFLILAVMAWRSDPEAATE